MKVRFIGISDPLCLLNGKIYNVESIECGWYRIIDETNEDYLYSPDNFKIIEKLPEPPIIEPQPKPKDMI